MSYQLFAQYDFETQVRIVRALNDNNGLKMSLTELMERILKSSLYVKQNDTLFNCLGFKYGGGIWQRDIWETVETFDATALRLIRGSNRVCEKGFTLKMFDDAEFREANAELIREHYFMSDGPMISIVNCQNDRAIRFTESFGFKRVSRFKSSRTGNDLFLFNYNNGVKK